jgi:hypothetical protein
MTPPSAAMRSDEALFTGERGTIENCGIFKSAIK